MKNSRSWFALTSLKTALPVSALVISAFCLDGAPARAEEYEVVPRGTAVRGHFWIADGPAYIDSSNQSFGNRFRLGGEAQFGSDYRFIAGATFYDLLSSGESSNIIGGISRDGWDFNFGVFLVPDKLWLEYSLQLGRVSTGAISGWVGTIGNGVNLGYQFYKDQNFNIGVEAGYMYIGSETVDVYNYVTNTLGPVTYPGANVVSLSIVFGYDIGGRG